MKKAVKPIIMFLLVLSMSIPVHASTSYTFSETNSNAYKGSSSTYMSTRTKTVFEYNDEGELIYSVTGKITYFYNYAMIGTSLYAQPISYVETLTIYDTDNDYAVDEDLSNIYLSTYYGKHAYATGYFYITSESADMKDLFKLKCTISGSGSVTWTTSVS